MVVFAEAFDLWRRGLALLGEELRRRDVEDCELGVIEDGLFPGIMAAVTATIRGTCTGY